MSNTDPVNKLKPKVDSETIEKQEADLVNQNMASYIEFQINCRGTVMALFLAHALVEERKNAIDEIDELNSQIAKLLEGHDVAACIVALHWMIDVNHAIARDLLVNAGIELGRRNNQAEDEKQTGGPSYYV